MVLRVGALPQKPVEASAEFHARILPHVLAELAKAPPHLVLLFDPAGPDHHGWRLSAVQNLAREHAPFRVNGLSGSDEAAIAAAICYLERAEGITGQLFAIDGNGAGEVLSKAQ